MGGGVGLGACGGVARRLCQHRLDREVAGAESMEVLRVSGVFVCVCVQVAKMPHRIYYSDKYYDANDYEYRCVQAALS